MPNVMPISGVAAGSTGSPYLTKLTYTTKATGNYPVTEANFAGIGAYLPGWVLVVAVTPANVTISLSNDNGATWNALGNTGGGWVDVDSVRTVRIKSATSGCAIVQVAQGL